MEFTLRGKCMIRQLPYKLQLNFSTLTFVLLHGSQLCADGVDMLSNVQNAGMLHKLHVCSLDFSGTYFTPAGKRCVDKAAVPSLNA
jgi:hypothetical protein